MRQTSGVRIAGRRTYDDPRRVGRSLLHDLVQELVGTPPRLRTRCPVCGADDHGRPVADGVHLSVAYAGDAVVVAASVDGPVGVDVESVHASAERLRAIRTVAGGEGLEHWTAVEAVLKADGRGLLADPRDIRFRDDHAEFDGVRYRITRPAIDPGLVVAVACVTGSAARS